MAEYSQVEITDALAAIIAGVDDVGVVLTDRRVVEEDSEILTLVQALNEDGEAKAWLVTLMQIAEVDTLNGCEIQQTLTYTLETLYPYRRKHDDGSTSESKFRAMLGAVFQAVRESRTLGLDARVWHKLLITQDDFKIMSWEATGSDGLLTHYARLRLEVTNAVFT